MSYTIMREIRLSTRVVLANFLFYVDSQLTNNEYLHKEAKHQQHRRKNRIRVIPAAVHMWTTKKQEQQQQSKPVNIKEEIVPVDTPRRKQKSNVNYRTC